MRRRTINMFGEYCMRTAAHRAAASTPEYSSQKFTRVIFYYLSYSLKTTSNRSKISATGVRSTYNGDYNGASSNLSRSTYMHGYSTAEMASSSEGEAMAAAMDSLFGDDNEATIQVQRLATTHVLIDVVC